MQSYKIRLVARNEGIEYGDEAGTYHFNVELHGKKWLLFLPCSRGDDYKSCELTPNEYMRILPRIVSYLERIKWLGFWSSTYTVEMVCKNLFDREAMWDEFRNGGWIVEHNANGTTIVFPPKLSK